jgi:HSP20 family protein
MPEQDPQPESRLTASAEKLRQELDRLLELAVSQGERALDAIGLRGAGSSWRPHVDVVETANEVRVDVDVPGVSPESLDINLTGNMLTVAGEKSTVKDAEHQTVHVRERAGGTFSHSIPLPVPVNPEEVAASTKNGVLEIRLNKAERAKARQIPITPVEQGQA